MDKVDGEEQEEGAMEGFVDLKYENVYCPFKGQYTSDTPSSPWPSLVPVMRNITLLWSVFICTKVQLTRDRFQSRNSALFTNKCKLYHLGILAQYLDVTLGKAAALVIQEISARV